MFYKVLPNTWSHVTLQQSVRPQSTASSWWGKWSSEVTGLSRAPGPELGVLQPLGRDTQGVRLLPPQGLTLTLNHGCGSPKGPRKNMPAEARELWARGPVPVGQSLWAQSVSDLRSLSWGLRLAVIQVPWWSCRSRDPNDFPPNKWESFQKLNPGVPDFKKHAIQIIPHGV